MLLRLADLYFEEGRDVYLTEMDTFRTQFDNGFNTPGCNTENMAADNAGSLVYQNKSIRLYKNILKTYPRTAERTRPRSTSPLHCRTPTAPMRR